MQPAAAAVRACPSAAAAPARPPQGTTWPYSPPSAPSSLSGGGEAWRSVLSSSSDQRAARCQTRRVCAPASARLTPARRPGARRRPGRTTQTPDLQTGRSCAAAGRGARRGIVRAAYLAGTGRATGLAAARTSWAAPRPGARRPPFARGENTALAVSACAALASAPSHSPAEPARWRLLRRLQHACASSRQRNARGLRACPLQCADQARGSLLRCTEAGRCTIGSRPWSALLTHACDGVHTRAERTDVAAPCVL
jgi:hypothetical protein